MKEYIEKEIKLEIDNPTEIISKLKANNARLIGSRFQKTIRFDTKELSYEKEGKFIRLRSGFSNTFTLKEKIDDDKNVRSRKETEFEISDIEKATYALKALGLDYLRIMEKYRQSWKYKEVEIEIDEMPFGIFIEIEGSEEDIIKTCTELNLDINKKILETYWGINRKINNSKDIVFEEKHEFKLKSIE